MGINTLQIIMVIRVNMYWRLETLLIEISLNFFFYVDEDTSLTQNGEYRRVISKKLNHSAKYTFSPQLELLLFQGQNAHTFGSLTAEPSVLA